MKILGISSDIWITSAALIDDGRIVAAAPEERFNRQKMYRNFPLNAIKFCLKEASCNLEDIDYVALAWNPGIHIRRPNFRFSDVIKWRAEHLYSIPNQLTPLLKNKKIDYIEQRLKQENGECKILYITHHLAHAANAFFLSPFAEAAILSIDGRGENATALFAIGRKNRIEEIQEISFPHSLGLFYGTVTEYLGFQPHSDEWKVMGMAAYAEGNNEYYDKFKKMTVISSNGKLELDLKYFSYYLQDQEHFYTAKFIELFGPARGADEELEERHYQIAAALQKISEEIAAAMLEWLHKKTGMENIVVNGGFFMNSVFNGKITAVTPFKKVFISSCPDDSGTSIGAALYAYNHIFGQKNRNEQLHNYYGPQFSDEEIKGVLDKFQIKFQRLENIEEQAAQLVAEGKIIGWFQGRMEFGQRALGNRSIIADPRDVKMKDKVNSVVKYRESFRPFAPSILEEYTAEYFECDPEARAPFMEKVYPIRKDKRNVIPAITHADGSGRLQTVSKQVNERYYKLIEEFYKITKVPVVLNTSFNVKGEPIVCSPIDAIRTFYSCGLDALIIGNYLVRK